MGPRATHLTTLVGAAVVAGGALLLAHPHDGVRPAGPVLVAAAGARGTGGGAVGGAGDPGAAGTLARGGGSAAPAVPAPGADPAAATSDDADPGTCHVDPAHPMAVLLLHGTRSTPRRWDVVLPSLRAAGWCAEALAYGHDATDPVGQSAEEVTAAARDLTARTGAGRVALVGHSQGGLIALWVSAMLREKVDVGAVISIAGDPHGTTTSFLRRWATEFSCQACLDQLAGSPALRELAASGGVRDGVGYTTIATQHDVIVKPLESQRLPRAANIVVQEDCPDDTADHGGLLSDPVAIQWILNALEHGGHADESLLPRC